MQDGWAIEVAHIIPYALAKNPQCRQLHFWRMMEILFGATFTDRMFTTLLSDINGMDNLVCLDISIHWLFDHGRLTLTPFTLDKQLISLFGTYTGSYWLTIHYPKGMSNPELVTSSKIWEPAGVCPLVETSQVYIHSYADLPNQFLTAPNAAYFALRAYLVRLRERCSRRSTLEHYRRWIQQNNRQ